MMGVPYEYSKYLKIDTDINKFKNTRLLLKKKINKRLHESKNIHKQKWDRVINEINFSPFINLNNIFDQKQNLFSTNPQHLTPTHILSNNFVIDNLLITEKADGVTKTLILNSKNTFPKIQDNLEVKAEYIESLNTYFVYDIDKPLDFIEKTKYLISIHEFIDLDNFVCSSLQDLNNYKAKILKQYQDFQNIKKDNNLYYWFPKPYWKIDK